MAVPVTWAAPASGGTNANAGVTQLSYANGYYFAASTDVTSKPVVRYTTDPTGTWSQATLPNPPTGFSDFTYGPTRVVYGGGYYALAVYYTSNTTSPYRAMRVLYASSPGGTWSQYQYDATEAHWPLDLLYDGTRFVVVGRKFAASDIGFIAYATTPGGTWTFNTSSATIGYTNALQVIGIDFDGTTYVTTAYSTATPAAPLMRYSTALTSGWATPSTPPSTLDVASVRYQSNGYWTAYRGGADFDNRIWQTTTPSGTWNQTIPNILGASDLKDIQDVFYDDGVWMIAGADEPGAQPVPALYYLAKTGSPHSPSGGWTAITGAGFNANSGGSGARLTGLYAGSGLWLAASDYLGELRYGLPRSAPTYLRQRQSPVRAPSRVRGVDLRQRQTPRITRP